MDTFLGPEIGLILCTAGGVSDQWGAPLVRFILGPFSGLENGAGLRSQKRSVSECTVCLRSKPWLPA